MKNEIAKKIKKKAFKGPNGLVISSFELRRIDGIEKYVNEKSLKEISSIIGPFSIIDGVTKFDIPRFLRDKHYDLSDVEYFLRLIHPEKFYVNEIYVTEDGIEQRSLVSKREQEGYFKYDYIYKGNKCVEIEKTQIQDPLNPSEQII